MDSQTLLEVIRNLSSLVKDADLTSLAMLGGTAVLVYNIPMSKLVRLFRKQDKHKNFAHVFPTLVDINRSVRAKLQHLRSELNADRCAVIQFHNGSNNLSGVDFAKMSCTHESVRSGLKPAQQDFLNLPVSAYSYLTNAAFDKEPRVVLNVDRLKKFDMSTYYLFKAHKCVSFILHPLQTDSERIIFGFIVVEFCKIREDILTDDARYLLKQYAERISALLENYENKDVLEDECETSSEET